MIGVVKKLGSLLTIQFSFYGNFNYFQESDSINENGGSFKYVLCCKNTSSKSIIILNVDTVLHPAWQTLYLVKWNIGELYMW
jgi:hypothetical protein